jgi:soluble lytic murein transglycosylase-like protein
MRFAALFVAALSASAGEFAVLENGFRLRAERHESLGDTTRLYTDTGTMGLPSSSIVRFEAEEYVKPPALPISPAEPAAAVPLLPVTGDPKELIERAAEKNGLLPEFVHSVAAVESAYQVAAVSPKGALGLMQLMPGTAKELGADPLDPEQNADAGARYLKQLLIKYQHSQDPVRLALAAYNAGPGAVDRYGTIPPYRETQAYVEKVLRKYLAQLKAKKTT